MTFPPFFPPRHRKVQTCYILPLRTPFQTQPTPTCFQRAWTCALVSLRHDADPNVRDNLGRRAGDSLCGAVTGLRGGAGAASSRLGTNGAGTPSAGGGGGSSSSANPENEPFSETRSLLAVARAQRSSRKSRSDSAASATASAKTSVHIKRLDAVDGGHASAFRAGGGMTLGAAADVASDERGGRAEVSRGGRRRTISRVVFGGAVGGVALCFRALSCKVW